jgi:hypothetical protein
MAYYSHHHHHHSLVLKTIRSQWPSTSYSLLSHKCSIIIIIVVVTNFLRTHSVLVCCVCVCVCVCVCLISNLLIVTILLTKQSCVHTHMYTHPHTQVHARSTTTHLSWLHPSNCNLQNIFARPPWRCSTTNISPTQFQCSHNIYYHTSLRNSKFIASLL